MRIRIILRGWLFDCSVNRLMFWRQILPMICCFFNWKS